MLNLEYVTSVSETILVLYFKRSQILRLNTWNSEAHNSSCQFFVLIIRQEKKT